MRSGCTSIFNIKTYVCLVICSCGMLLLVVRCNKKFDQPFPETGEGLHANISMAQLRAMHFPGGFEKIMDDYIAEVIVVANDKKDNFYKSICVQDSTGGITVRMDGFGLYNDYPVGRKLFIRLRDMWLGDYANMIQLGVGVDRSDSLYPELTGIPVPLFDKFIVKGSLENAVNAKTITLDQLTDSFQSCLVKITDVEFTAADTGKTYGDAINKLTVNNIIRSCTGASVYLRTSGFAGFASARTPRGNGSVTAIYSVFRNEKQLMIRDTADIRMEGLRCTGAGSKILLREDFETTVENMPVNLPGWKNITEAGSKTYMSKIASGNRYAEISAFASGQSSVISWLILPPVDLNNSANEVLSFQTKDAFDNGGTLNVYISTNYDGGNTPAKAKWTQLKSVISKGSGTSIAPGWVSSGNISLAAYAGVVYLGFRYDGADPAATVSKRTTSFQVDNIRISGN